VEGLVARSENIVLPVEDAAHVAACSTTIWFSRVIRVQGVSEPTSGTGGVKLRARAASRNPLDCKIRDGELRFLPVLARPSRVSGCDFVGERAFGALSPIVEAQPVHSVRAGSGQRRAQRSA
jgi:hypothetical protein